MSRNGVQFSTIFFSALSEKLLPVLRELRCNYYRRVRVFLLNFLSVAFIGSGLTILSFASKFTVGKALGGTTLIIVCLAVAV